jgi:hypothetical protein
MLSEFLHHSFRPVPPLSTGLRVKPCNETRDISILYKHSFHVVLYSAVYFLKWENTQQFSYVCIFLFDHFSTGLGTHYVQRVWKVTVHLQKLLGVMSTRVCTGLNSFNFVANTFCRSVFWKPLCTCKSCWKWCSRASVQAWIRLMLFAKIFCRSAFGKLLYAYKRCWKCCQRASITDLNSFNFVTLSAQRISERTVVSFPVRILLHFVLVNFFVC